MVLLWLEKVKWNDFFCKKGISYTNCPWKSKKLHIKPAKTLQKRCFYLNLHLNSVNGPGPFAEFCKRSRDHLRNSVNGPGTVCRIPQMVPGRLRKALKCGTSYQTRTVMLLDQLLGTVHLPLRTVMLTAWFRPFRKRSGTVYRIPQTVPDRLQKSSKVGGGSWKNHLFLRFFAHIVSRFLLFPQ